MGKPAYRVPLMTEIAQIPDNGLRVVSTFSGAGGSCLGFKMAGFRVLWANEFIPAAQDTYRANHSDTILNTCDIRSITANDIRSAIGDVEVDVLEGSPPCAAFSSAGKLEAGWGKVKAYSDTEQRVDDLFYEFARILRELRPKVFVAENVSGLVRGVAIGYFKNILATLRGCDYRVEARLLDASLLGVPQARKRVIFMGVRRDLNAEPRFPRPLPYRYTVREVLPHIVALKLGGRMNNWQSSARPAGTITQSDGARASTTAYFGSYMVRDADGNERKWTIPELKKLCGFPDDFVLTGDFAQQWERLGRAVPPVMMAHVARCVFDVLSGKGVC